MASQFLEGKGSEAYLQAVRAGEIIPGGTLAVAPSSRSGRTSLYYEVLADGNLSSGHSRGSPSSLMISTDSWKYTAPNKQGSSRNQ